MFLIYEYIRRHSIQNPIEIKYGQFMSEQAKLPIDLSLDRPRKICIIVDIASLADEFGDKGLLDIMLCKLEQILRRCTDEQVLAALSILYKEDFSQLPCIQPLRRAVVVDGCLRGFNSITHDLWRGIGQLAVDFPSFKNDLNIVAQAVSENRDGKRLKRFEIDATPT